jgi:hypothetical protein
LSRTDPSVSALASEWAKAAELLHIEIVAPFSVTLPSGSIIGAKVLVKGFGPPNGMLLVTDYASVRDELEALEAAGFGFSVLEEPAESSPFVLDEFIELLQDWGWAGNNRDKPQWMKARIAP